MNKALTQLSLTLHHRIGGLEIPMCDCSQPQTLHHRIGGLENFLDNFKRAYELHHRIGGLEISTFAEISH